MKHFLENYPNKPINSFWPFKIHAKQALNHVSVSDLLEQEAAALAATQFAIVVQSAQSSRGLLVASAAPAVASLATPHREQV